MELSLRVNIHSFSQLKLLITIYIIFTKLGATLACKLNESGSTFYIVEYEQVKAKLMIFVHVSVAVEVMLVLRN